ncbi:MAG: phosphoenolpyruvate synthase [Solirubrobacteraceae bacterium]|nr:phosphoenolpyruvate synthase [Solirubrobacteraceae bacterium]
MGTDEQQMVVGLAAEAARDVAVAGGKGASLAVLGRLDGVTVPAGVVVTTRAFRTAVGGAPEIGALNARLERLWADEREAIGRVSAELRAAVLSLAVPTAVGEELRAALTSLGDADAEYAVRSSATTEDAADASFAGQHESFLGVVGAEAVIDHVRRCWASLFTEQAVTYRLRNGVAHEGVEMAVVVQRLVPADAAGVLFTADPVNGNRSVVAIEAVRGLGEALVSGTVIPDGYRVRGDEMLSRSAADGAAVLTDGQVHELAALGRHIEAQLGSPQDIEWCLAAGELAVVQSRPITTLFPIPDPGDDDRHVYVSVGHQQMMTDPIKPLGISVFQLTAGPQMHEAGSRLFVDVGARLADPVARVAVIDALGTSDPLIGGALREIVDREFIAEQPGAAAGMRPPTGIPPAEPLPTSMALVDELVANTEAAIAALRADIAEVSGPALFDFIADHIQRMKGDTFDPRSLQAIMSGMEAAWWLNAHVAEWLGERNVADTLAQSVPGNVTSEMGLALLDVADALRPHPEVIAFLEAGVDDTFLTELPSLPGGAEVVAAIDGFLGRYGVRCVGEIDITRPRWHEHPAALVPVILGNVRNFAAGEGTRRFEEGRIEAEAKADEILARLRALPDDGEAKAAEAAEMIKRVRTFTGYREFPKFGIVSRYAIYKQALLAEADRLVAAGVLSERDDCFFLRFDELHAAVRGEGVDRALIAGRKAAFDASRSLTPPRVITSEGEVLTGSYGRADAPEGALVGLAVSSGTIEGRARVVHDIADADVEPGDILVTAFTDPSWTPVFVTIAGLVTEVGGLMTHGAVVAREYGLPAVVGVERATQLIEDGQRIRVHGTDGFVEVLA